MPDTFSYHTFLFPFKWEVYQGKKHPKMSLIERTRINGFSSNLDDFYWQKFQFQVKNFKGWNTNNEYNYFYDHTRDVLNLNSNYKGINILQYEYSQLNESSCYIIDIKGIEYRLKINEILLNIYENGIGVLSFFLENQSVKNYDEILKINDFGRRFFPQYLEGKEPCTSAPKENFLCRYIKIVNINSPAGNELFEDFSYYDSLSNIQECPFILPKHIQGLLGYNFKSYMEPLMKGNIAISPIIDDRMFVISYILDSQKFEEMAKAKFSQNLETEYAYAESEKWYEYVFVDGSGSTCKSKPMLKQQIKDATHDRWIENTYENKPSGILYGISRYSFVGLASNNWFYQNIVDKHFNNQYFQLVLLSLVQRAYIINFSGEVSRISDRLNNENTFNNSESRSISKLYLLYIKFVNRIFFREVTPQEQGIEIYDILQKQLRIRDEIKDLDAEIEELNSYAQSQNQNRLTLIAGRFLIPTLVVSILGLDPIKDFLKNLTNGQGLSWWQVLLLIILSYFSSDFIISKTTHKNQ